MGNKELLARITVLEREVDHANDVRAYRLCISLRRL